MRAGKLRKQYSCQNGMFFRLGSGTDLALFRIMIPKSFPVALVAAVVFAGAFFAPTHSGGQTGDDILLVQLTGDLTTQQAAIADNQAKIDAKLAKISENVRLARIYAGRAGGKVP